MNISKLNESFFWSQIRSVVNTESQTDKVIPTGRSPLDTIVPLRSNSVLCQDFIMAPTPLLHHVHLLFLRPSTRKYLFEPTIYQITVELFEFEVAQYLRISWVSSYHPQIIISNESKYIILILYV